jgi:hypothetical protein
MKEHKFHFALIAWVICICIGGTIFFYKDWMYEGDFINRLVRGLLFTFISISFLFGLKIALDYSASKYDNKVITKLKKHADSYWEKAQKQHPLNKQN